ncbi:MAG TPA: DUF4442 domain-containing protein [Solimonas sp.]|nr:DUF4442 domain-containing protein [Solimonas sp.]
MAKSSLLRTAVDRLRLLPVPLFRQAVTRMFNFQVRFAGTAGVRFEELTEERAVLVLENRRKVQNHIGGIHAAAMALLAETGSGALFGMNVPPTHLPLIKSMNIRYVRRAQGQLRAEATLSAEQRERIRNEPKGDVLVPVKVIDESGEQPIECEMTWAWVPKQK